MLDGEKTWISNGGIADVYCVFARTGEAPGAKGISAFVVPADAPGLAIAERYDVIAPHPLARLAFDGCRVPADALIGAPGEGFKLAMRTLDVFRASVAAAALGFARRALDESVAHARQRTMFGGTLADLQLTQAELGDVATEVEGAALLTARAAWKRDTGSPAVRTTREAAMAKLAATEAAQRAADRAVQLHGAEGVRVGSVVERLYREVRALRIYEGATEVQRLIVGRDELARSNGTGGTGAMSRSAHVDTFARDRLPPRELLPDLVFDLPELEYPERINVASEILGGAIARGDGDRIAIHSPAGTRWTYRGARRAGVPHRPPARRRDGRRAGQPRDAARPQHADDGGLLVRDHEGRRDRGGDDAAAARARADRHRHQGRGVACAVRRAAGRRDRAGPAAVPDAAARDAVRAATGTRASSASRRRSRRRSTTCPTDAEDIALIAFTSGTTGRPKGTMHTHRDVLAASDCWPKHTLRADRDDVFTGSPPLAFTFGLGGLAGVSAAHRRVDAAGRAAVAGRAARRRREASADRARGRADRLPRDGARQGRARPRRACASASRPARRCPPRRAALWKDATGIDIIDGIGSTEMFHIFISHRDDDVRPGATGKPVPGYRACVIGDDGKPLPPGQVGRLAVKGPTGCKYLDDPRQASYVHEGWNLTGDAYLVDDDGWFVYQARSDDMIVSSGYNIAGPGGRGGADGAPGRGRLRRRRRRPARSAGMIVHAFVVLKPGHAGDDATTRALQEHVKATIAPYKYPRAVSYVDALPRTETGKVQRFKLRATREGEPA